MKTFNNTQEVTRFDETLYVKMHHVRFAREYLQTAFREIFRDDLDWSLLKLMPTFFSVQRTLFIIQTIVYQIMTFDGYKQYVLVLMGDENRMKTAFATTVERLMAKVIVCYRDEKRPKPFPLVYSAMIHQGEKPRTLPTLKERHIDSKRLMQYIELELQKRQGFSTFTVVH